MAGKFKSHNKQIRFIHLQIITIILLTLLITSGSSVHGRVWHVCMDCEKRDAITIGEAISMAKPRDTILVYWEPRLPYYMEHLVIDKPLRIISHPAAGDFANYDYFPVLTASGKEIIHITVPGVELIGFNIMYLTKPVLTDDDTTFEGQTGILLSAPALIRHCAITNCRAGILTAYNTPEKPSGSRIQMCRIGLPPDHGLNRKDLRQTRNLFGMVLLGSRKNDSELGKGTDQISDCQIMRNVKYGVVHTPENRPAMQQNIIELNGLAPFRIALPELDSNNQLKWLAIDKSN